MATHTATVLWQRGDESFLDKRYSRRHTITFDGGVVLPASSSPHVVPVPFSDPAGVDPEESFIASLSSCHMLWFLSIAVQQGFCVDRYHDAAEGVMGRNAEGRLAMTVVTLRPAVHFGGNVPPPTTDQLHALHHAAHEACFIANSVKTEVRCEPVL